MTKLALSLPEVPKHWHAGRCTCEPGVVYVRVSKVGNRDRIVSPDLQLAAAVEWAKANNVRIVDVVFDIDKSGKTFRKRSIDKIISRIERGEFRRVILWKWSRWARNTQESAKYLAKVRQVGGRVDSATEDSDQDTAIGRLQMDLIMRFDQYVLEQMTETWHSIFEQRREAGLPHGGRPRFGYRYMRTESVVDGMMKIESRYVPKADEAAALRRSYERYVGGASFETIMEDLRADGFRTTRGGQWNPLSVARMMDTGFAAGLIRERSAPTGAPSNSIASYDVWRTGSHEPIIQMHVWEAYKARRLRQAAIPPRARRAVHALSALLFCSECGRRLITKYTGAGRTHQWQCPWQRSYHPTVSVTASNRILMAAVQDWISRNARGEEEVQRLVEEAHDELTGAGKADRAVVEGKVRDAEAKLDRIARLYAEARLDDARYDDLHAVYEKELREARGELEALEPTVVVSRPDREVFESLMAVWPTLSTAVQREALAAVLAKVVVSPRTESTPYRSAEGRVSFVGVWEVDALER